MSVNSVNSKQTSRFRRVDHKRSDNKNVGASSCSVISRATARMIGENIVERHLEDYDKHLMTCIGEATVSIKLFKTYVNS